ncbi:glycosyltransferase family 2 protein [Flavobacterium urocaniciphilum]|uniref:Glycosyltransferase, catalytic subunit of cellulose synthase and poly-beta-1,6-N-acetylglucosamine synthase n=1 Tax=Flavobacterium urocaniciphilum TaxID=1299341 RepID=A0A1H9AFX5_9FLAO|nr:glycosyltransferase [Flavobacterium urocaniciphilum]SEP75485.1 Glycosyltransferase, catalytic subunit of cellulose synthase and poly-beta-1,6-N-acetylglucosamine synthase [Flavobacterium urocaniciphilum]
MILFVVLLFFYVALITQLAFGMVKMNKQNTIQIIEPKTRFSIVVPFRNEAENLPKLLKSIEKLNYPTDLFEVILVDDESEEKFQILNSKFQISLISNQRKSNSPKKDAIETAIQLAKYDWIVTTDADCEVPENWLTIFDSKIQDEQAKMCVGSVAYKSESGFLHDFQNNDFLSLQGVTAGSFGIEKPFMCNGANFAYQKTFFNELNGFEGNNSLASGDDVFLLQKAMKVAPEKIAYLGNWNVVFTKSCESWKALIHQRVRWASKTTAYTNWYPKILGLVVFLTNLSSFLLLLLPFYKSELLQMTIYYWLVKFGIDFLFLKFSSTYFRVTFKNFLGSFILYPFFTVLVVMKVMFGKFEWKNRQFN